MHETREVERNDAARMRQIFARLPCIPYFFRCCYFWLVRSVFARSWSLHFGWFFFMDTDYA